MANNFDLRQFLTENKLTKNAQLLNEAVTLDGKPVHVGSIEIDDIDTRDYPDFSDAYITYAEFEDGTPLSEDELMRLEDENYGLTNELIHDRQMYMEGAEVEEGVLDEAKSYKTSPNSKEAQHLKKGDIIGSGDEVVSVSAGAKTPAGKVEVTLKTKDGKTKTSTWGKTTKVGVKEKETVKENTMNEREQYLTRLVENALGLDITEDDNVDYTMGHQDDPNQLPNPAPELNIPEGDEMVNEKPLPKYENIEKLMQEIDKNTDEAAHKYKMEEMKRVADGLEKKATALEEGDDSDHIDQKKLKQMKKDIMSLRKNIEKMEKLGEKKFAKKETKAELKEGFDLRNFLVENKLTSNSRTQE